MSTWGYRFAFLTFLFETLTIFLGCGLKIRRMTLIVPSMSCCSRFAFSKCSLGIVGIIVILTTTWRSDVAFHQWEHWNSWVLVFTFLTHFLTAFSPIWIVKLALCIVRFFLRTDSEDFAVTPFWPLFGNVALSVCFLCFACCCSVCGMESWPWLLFDDMRMLVM